MYRFCCVPFGIVCSPFLLAGTIKFHLKQFGGLVAQLINDNIYVNNVMLGANSVEQAHKIYLESKRILQKPFHESKRMDVKLFRIHELVA